MKPSKRERTQKEILEAAKAIIRDKGYEALTVRCLAEETGYSYTNLYYYFKDLSALLWKLRLYMIEDMIAELTDVSLPGGNYEYEILDAIYRYTDYFFDHPNVFRFFYFYPFIAPEGDDGYQKLEQRFQGMWNASFLRLTEEGIIQPDDIKVVSKTIIYAVQGMIMLGFSSNGTASREDIKDEIKELINYLLKNKQSK